MISLLLTLATALLLPGVINRTRAVCSGRKGYRFFQPLMTVGVLLRKGSVYSSVSTAVTRIAPVVYLATMLTATLFLPLGIHGSIISFQGDVVLFAYLLALGRVAMIWGAMDSGSSFQGMGASREALFAVLAEPALFLLIGTLALITGNFSFSAIFSRFDNISINLLILSIVVGYGFLKLMISECGRVPFDDPRTHLELTMIHEVMVLDLSGIDLAFVQIAQWLKLSIFGLLIANSLIPATQTGWLLVLYFAGIQFLLGIFIGVGESFTARNRMSRNATYLATVSAIGVLAFIVAVILALGGGEWGLN